MLPLLPLLLALSPARAAGGPASCPEGNLLAGRAPSGIASVDRPERLVDGVRVLEGETWSTELAARLRGEAASVTWDLGRPTRLRAVVVQGDDDDAYAVEVSADGASWTEAWRTRPRGRGGLRLHGSRKLDATARTVRLRAVSGDGRFAVAEIELYCEVPEAWPPPARVARSTWPARGGSRGRARALRKAALGGLGIVLVGATAPSRRGRPRWALLAAATALAMLALAVAWGHAPPREVEWAAGALGVLLLGGWGFAVARALRRGRDWTGAAVRGALLAASLVGAYAWTQFGGLQGPRAVHHWDSFHYFVGARYHRELGYTRLYDCATVAQAEDGFEDATGRRGVRDLATNTVRPASAVVETRAEDCRRRFSEERWRAFKQDVRLWRRGMAEKYWRRLFRDHGYNATPVWNMVGSAIANLGWRSTAPPPELEDTPANRRLRTAAERRAIRERARADMARFDRRLALLASIDWVLLGAIWELLWWGFGLRAAALGTLVLGVGHPWEYTWTGGAFGRVPWLFWATVSLVLLRRGRPFLAGLAGGASALLRLFPAVFGAGVVLRGLRPGPARRTALRWVAGAGLAAAVLVPASLPSAGGVQGWVEFARNIRKHDATPLTNHMGLPTVLASDPWIGARTLRDERLEDAFERWKAFRRENLARRRPLWLGLVGATLVLLGWAAPRMRAWEAWAASTILAIALFQLTCYYYAFAVLVAPLAERRVRWAAAWLGAAALTQVAQTLLPWNDEAYVVETLVVLAALAAIVADRARLGPELPPPAGEAGTEPRPTARAGR